MAAANSTEWSGISEFQLYLFNEGTNFQSYQMLGPHKIEQGWRFAVWAPNARGVFLAGDFNQWDTKRHPLAKIGTTGVWYGVFPEIEEGSAYKYAVYTPEGKVVLKADPFAYYSELRPHTASIVCELPKHKWKDRRWLEKRAKTPPYDKPMNIYEVHAGSWKTHADGSFYSYRELAEELVPYVADMGYTHIELMPLTEYPFDGSWGYQVTGFFAATSRYGTPADLMYFVDVCHAAGIGVIMDWVPAHFPKDAHGLYRFDGTPAYEYADARMGEHKDWGTMVFDYAKGEVVSFLMSSAYFWLEQYHVDGLRVDAVSSMLYRDYSRRDGEWLPNIYGGNQNLEAIAFLRKLNTVLFSKFPNILMIAEESTSWGMVTGRVEDGGLGFNYKWNMGWMNDTLRYMSMDPLFRGPNHNLLTFLMFYAYSENYILPLSHDEVVHGKRSLVDKMFGTYEQKFATYRALLAYYMSLPGKKLLFMGGEIAQFIEWRYDEGLEWGLLEFDAHRKFWGFVRELNHFYLDSRPFWEIEDSWDGYQWINGGDTDRSVLSYIRKGKRKSDQILVVANFTPEKWEKYVIGVPSAGEYEIVFNTAWSRFGGNKRALKKAYKAQKKDFLEFRHVIELDLPGLSVLYLRKKKPEKQKK